jgi:hypothetical protein
MAIAEWERVKGSFQIAVLKLEIIESARGIQR